MTVQCPVCDRRLKVKKDSPRKCKCPCGAIIILASSVAVPHRRKERLRPIHKKPVSHSDTTQIALSVVMPPPVPEEKATKRAPGRRKTAIPGRKTPVSRKKAAKTSDTAVMRAIWTTPVTAKPGTEETPAVELEPVTPTSTTTPSVIVSVPTDREIADQAANENLASQVLLLILLALFLAGVLWVQWPLL